MPEPQPQTETSVAADATLQRDALRVLLAESIGKPLERLDPIPQPEP
jgi:hypothetical protein